MSQHCWLADKANRVTIISTLTRNVGGVSLSRSEYITNESKWSSALVVEWPFFEYARFDLAKFKKWMTDFSRFRDSIQSLLGVKFIPTDSVVINTYPNGYFEWNEESQSVNWSTLFMNRELSLVVYLDDAFSLWCAYIIQTIERGCCFL